jgi:hypothetical protein
MNDPLKDKRVKDCPDCKVVIMMGEAFTFYCSKHSRFGAIAQRPTKRAPDARKSALKKVSSNKKGSAKPARG